MKIKELIVELLKINQEAELIHPTTVQDMSATIPIIGIDPEIKKFDDNSFYITFTDFKYRD